MVVHVSAVGNGLADSSRQNGYFPTRLVRSVIKTAFPQSMADNIHFQYFSSWLGRAVLLGNPLQNIAVASFGDRHLNK